jgi:hypothetical protein
LVGRETVVEFAHTIVLRSVAPASIDHVMPGVTDPPIATSNTTTAITTRSHPRDGTRERIARDSRFQFGDPLRHSTSLTLPL